MRKLLEFVLIALFLLPQSCFIQRKSGRNKVFTFKVSLQPGPIEGKDAFIEDYPLDNYRNRNWADSEEFAAISWTAGGEKFVVRSFIDFNFDTIPADATIDSAKLSLYAHGNSGHGVGHDTLGGSNACYLERITGAWSEHSITWNTQPETSLLNRIQIPRSKTAMQDYKRIDITPLVRDIHANPEQSHGLMLRLEHERGYRRVFFASSDVADAAKRPKLEVWYSIR